ncbi:c-type cytochrome [Novosphingobium sp. Leaf2]|uniref:c-type cytochrome n=1 Tax=Novosphingobium sp. Leaf2 TaxID=1735670 RepID=UPI0006FE521F|nr:c-type cytochrome [Novosphingobium sp. Leaf2]KQM21358.1 cytochrome C [Novosphingobium sp. Leaf2]
MHRSFTLLVMCAALSVSGCGRGKTDDRDARLRQAGPNPSFAALMRVASADAGAAKFGQCAACHTIEDGGMDRGGPNLFGVFKKPFATNSASFGYTAALSKAGGVWDEKTLNAWIAGPSALVPGTSMQFAGVSDPLDRADIIAYLRRQRPAK